MPSRNEIVAAVSSAITVASTAPVIFTSAVAAFGFGTGGIIGGTPAAALMASYGGTVTSGSICSTLQSIGAAGLGPTGLLVTSAVGAAISLGITAFNAGSNSPILIVIQGKEGFTLALEVKPLDTIEDVKTKIEIKSGIPKDRQILHFSGLPLEHHRKVQDYGIRDQSVIILVS
ncbi:ribosomal 40S subunit protein S27A [Mortierella sp. AD094]|nr:ribosomal 40S subunit protein S27A [Mortierella sp. AD094]